MGESVKSADDCMGWAVKFVWCWEMAKDKWIVGMKQVVRTEALLA